MKKKAFTLVELLVVIAIIAIFAALFIPVINQVKQKQEFINGNIETLNNFKVGDKVVINGLNITGVVETVFIETVDIVFTTPQSTGIQKARIKAALLRKIY